MARAVVCSAMFCCLPRLDRACPWSLRVIGICLMLLILTNCGGSSGSPSVLLPVIDPSDLPPPQQLRHYQIQLRFPQGQITPAQQGILQQAAQRWSQLIIGDVEDVSLTLPQGACLAGVPGISQRIDDLVIDVALVELDGLGGVLARAGPCVLRQGSLLPAYGIVQLDRQDVAILEAQERLLPAVLHEYGHVLGFGSLWSLRQLIQGAGSEDPRYRGERANQAFQRLQGGSNQVPIENQGGAGSRDTHWREAVLDAELMTGSLDLGLTPLSLITASSFVDLGYLIDPTQVDEYVLPVASEPAPERLQAQLPVLRQWEGPGPEHIWVISPTGEHIQTVQRK